MPEYRITQRMVVFEDYVVEGETPEAARQLVEYGYRTPRSTDAGDSEIVTVVEIRDGVEIDIEEES